MCNSIQIQCVQNGFITRPVVNERHSEAKPDSICVFETHKALFEYLEARFPINIDPVT